MPSSAEIVQAIPVILSLIMIEGLLSVDNSLAIAAMARRVPAERRQAALNWGMAGAYGFRCLCLIFASVIIKYTSIKVLGAAYLVYLMCVELTQKEESDEEGGGEGEERAGAHTFGSVVAGILFLDASLSVDNVIAAIAMTPQLWAVYVGVGIGILALRLLAPWCIRMIEKFPILEKTAFLLVGYVGLILLCEIATETHFGPMGKFIGIVVITATCLGYERSEGLRKALAPVIFVFRPIMAVVATVCGWIVWPIKALVNALIGLFGSK